MTQKSWSIFLTRLITDSSHCVISTRSISVMSAELFCYRATQVYTVLYLLQRACWTISTVYFDQKFQRKIKENKLCKETRTPFCVRFQSYLKMLAFTIFIWTIGFIYPLNMMNIHHAVTMYIVKCCSYNNVNPVTKSLQPTKYDNNPSFSCWVSVHMMQNYR